MLTDSDVGAMQASDGMSTFTVHKKRVASTSTSFGTTNPQFLYHLCESALNNTVFAHRILGGKLLILFRNAANDDYLETRTTNHLITTTKNLSTAIGNASGFQSYFNATTPAEDVEESGASFDSTTTEFTIGAEDGLGTATRFYDGQIEELIIYKSAVTTDNRFEIENNINNYYSLYNDENEVTGAFTASGQDSFTANGTNGFTIVTATANAFAGMELNEKVADNNIIYVSFNADLTNFGTPTVELRKTSISGTLSSDAPSSGQPAVVKGFNSFALVCDDADAKFVTFTEGDNNVGYTISDFRISRIARNGFVESWYDQSGSGKNAAQTTATIHL